DEIIKLSNLKLEGLMTMGPLVDEPEKARPFLKLTKELFDEMKFKYKNKLDLHYLSMGMSDTYKIAIEEGANIVRIGRAIFDYF
ncbi:MAG: alanine racemase, partial [Candidatus Aenigmatarchaeota archaeon]